MALSDRQRAALERRIIEALNGAWAGRADALLRYLGDPPSAGNVPASFWTRLENETRDALTIILAQAGAFSAEALAAEAGVSGAVNWRLVNTRAANWAAQYSFELVRGITDTTRDRLRGLVAGFVKDPAQDLKALGGEIGKLFGPVRGEMIAVTEATRASAQGELALIEEIRAGRPDAGVAQVWLTSRDELVCPICGPLHGKRKGNGWTDPPPAHPRCLPGDTLVSAVGVSAVSERSYNGDIVVIHTASGNNLSCTPNHPILTPGGWVPAGKLNKGGYVISGSFREGVFFGSYLDNENVPARIQDISKTFRSSEHVAATPVPVSTEDFHGDGVGSEVAVVWTNGLLSYGGYPAIDEHFQQFALNARYMQLPRLYGKRMLDFGFKSNWPSTRSRVSSGNLSGAFGLRHLCPLYLFGFTLASNHYPGFNKPVPNHIAGDVEFFGDGIFGCSRAIHFNNAIDRDANARFPFDASISNNINAGSFKSARNNVSRDSQLAADLIAGLSGPVFFDEIVSVDRDAFHGFVFNLETNSGAYMAEGIITHNCRCAVRTEILLPEAENA